MSREKYRIRETDGINEAVLAFLGGTASFLGGTASVLGGTASEHDYVSSDGVSFMRKGQVIAWWSDDEIYMMIGPISGAVTWLNQLHEALGAGPRVFGFVGYDYAYNGRPLGADEVVKLEIPV